MSKFNLYEVRGDWDVSKGTLISTHKTKELAHKRMLKEAKKKVSKLYYWRELFMTDKLTIIDYGSWSKFLAIEEVE